MFVGNGDGWEVLGVARAGDFVKELGEKEPIEGAGRPQARADVHSEWSYVTDGFGNIVGAKATCEEDATGDSGDDFRTHVPVVNSARPAKWTL